MGAVYSVQYLRFLAAALVVLTHGVMSLNHSLGSRVFGDFPQGGRGVDIFLVISGFIMVYITKNRQMTPLRFAFERLTRIVPLYWIFTMLMMLVVALVPGLVNAQQLEFWHTLSSYLFVPSPHPDGGAFQPLLRVGWTLNIEMLFYLMIVLAMVINYVNWTRIVIVWVAALVIFGTIGESSAPSINLWTSAYMLHLITGMLLGRLWEKLPSLHPLVALGLIGLGLVGLLTLPPQEAHGVTPGFLLVSLCSTAIVLGALTLERAGRVARIGWLVLLGNASYALYLSHYFVIGLVRALWPAEMVGTFPADIAFLVTVLLTSSAVSVVVYRYIERPLTVYLRDATPNLARLVRGAGRSPKC